VAGALVPHSRQEPAPGMAGRSMRPHARVWTCRAARACAPERPL